MYLSGIIWRALQHDHDSKTTRTVALLFLSPFLCRAVLMTKQLDMFYYLHAIAPLAVTAGAMISSLLPPALMPRDRRQLLAIAYLFLLAANIIAASLGGRYLALAYQSDARDYRQVRTATSGSIPGASIVWGPPQVWYALEEVGAELRLLGEPDPKTHDYAIVASGSEVLSDHHAHLIQRFGQPLPQVFGLIDLPSRDYQFEIWEWDGG
jgi:hypothetical protein